MSNKNKNKDGVVYSTNPEYFNAFAEAFGVKEETTAKQNLLVRKSTQGRAGKVATLVQRFVGSESALEDLAKDLKKHCGTGGSVKNGEIIIQGDQSKKIADYLTSKGMKVKIG
jgi:translation initiation factor 1